jgi:hypothetical protein
MVSLRSWQTLPKNPSILQASSTTGNDDWTEFPIGMSYQWLKYPSSLLGNHSELLLCAVSTYTNPKREVAVKNLETNGFQNTSVSPERYFYELPKYKFVVSPEGNGLDCHRHYEALMAGCIPILQRNPQIEKKYSGCPILWTTDYSEITTSYLEEKYSEMIDQNYDFSCLNLSHYPYDLQLKINRNSNYWINLLIPKKKKLLPFLKI